MLIAEKVVHHILNEFENQAHPSKLSIYFIGFSEVIIRIISTIEINKEKFDKVNFIPISMRGFPLEVQQINESIGEMGIENSVRPCVNAIADLKKINKRLDASKEIIIFGCERATPDNRFIVMRGVSDILKECKSLNIEPILTFEEYKIMDYDSFDKIKNISSVQIEEIEKDNFDFEIITGQYHTTKNLTRMERTKNLEESYRVWVKQIGSESYYVPKSNYMSCFLKEKVSEALTSKIIETSSNAVGLKFLELGIGSGEVSIGIIEKTSDLKNVKVSGTGVEINPWAIDVAEQNILSFALNDQIKVVEGNYFDPISNDTKFDLIIGNLPQMPEPGYSNIKTERWVSAANDGGIDGYKDIIKVINNCRNYLVKNGSIILVIFEFLYTDKLKQIFSANNIWVLTRTA